MNELKIDFLYEHPVYKDYACDEDGNVYSFKRGKIRKMKPWMDRYGYLSFSVYNGKLVVQPLLVHRFVWECIKGEIIEGYDIDHINYKRDDNRIENLLAIPASENRARKSEEGKKRIGESAKKACSKPVVQLDMLDNIIAEFPSTIDAERQTGVAQESISRCCNEKLKTAGGFKWKNKESLENNWVDINGYEGYYQMNDIGNVMNKKTGKIKKPWKNNRGYLVVDLSKNKECKHHLLHRLVYARYHGNIPSDMVIDHINGIKDDNRIENLRCVTPKENSNNPITKKRLDEGNKKRYQNPEYRKKNAELLKKIQNKRIEGVKKANSKPVLEYTLDFEFVKEWASTMEIQRELGYANTNISACCRGKCKQAYGKIWRYKNKEVAS